MAHYQFILAYDGTDFQGSQRQGSKRTVQLVFEDALRKLGWDARSIVLAGRTDSGVHAIGQSASTSLEWKHSSETLTQALNANLPDDLAVTYTREVTEGFHARYDAAERTYRYRILASAQRNPIKERFSWRVWPMKTLYAMQELAAMFVGEHDFASFGSKTSPKGTTVREVYNSLWERQGDYLVYVVSANGFLYHMVRRMVFSQIEVVKGNLKPQDLKEAIANPSPIRLGMAPAKGLILESVSYDR